MAKTRIELCQELADELKIWNRMNDDIESMKYTGTQIEHTAQRRKIEILIRELESLNQAA